MDHDNNDSNFMSLTPQNTNNPRVQLGGRNDGDYSHPMNTSPEEYQRFLPGAYANFREQAQRDRELFIRNFPNSKRHTTYLTHPQPSRTTNYLNDDKNHQFPSAAEYYSQDNMLRDGPEPEELSDRKCETRPTRVVTVNRESVDQTVHQFQPGEGHYQGFSQNIDNDSRGKGLGGMALSKCPEQSLTPVFPGASMQQLHPSPEGIEKIVNSGGENPSGACCHPGNKILHCQDKMKLPSCQGPLLQSHNPSGAMSDRYLQTFRPELYRRRDEHSFGWNEFSRREGHYRPEIRKRRVSAETPEAYPFQLECTRVAPPMENCDRCHHLFNNLTHRKNLFQH